MNKPYLTVELAAQINCGLGAARAKFPNNQNLTVALMEEAGELAQAQLQSRPRSEVDAECLDVIVVALRILTEGDASIPRVEAVTGP